MTQVAQACADEVIVTEDELYGEPFSSIVAEMNVPDSMTICQDRKKAIQMAISRLDDGDCVIVT
jgi:UDP-N-acetylmuramyl tripeptide synthase